MALVEDLKSRFDEIVNLRSPWEGSWRHIGELVIPRRMDRARGFSMAGTPSTQGEILSNRIFDATAAFAAEQLASFLGTQLINPQEDWFELRFRDQSLNDDRDAASWLRTTKTLMMTEFNSASSSFHVAMAEAFLDLVSFGTATVSAVENRVGRPTFVARPLTEMYLGENADGEVDTIYRRFDWSPRQIIQFFGEVPPPLAEQFKRMTQADMMSRRIPLVHAVFPREDLTPGRRDALGMPWASIYFSLEPLGLIREGGFLENPFITPRWTKASGDVYGRSPAFTVMPDIRMLQSMSKVVISAAQTRIKKPIQVPDDGFIGPLRLLSGGVNVYRATSKQRIEPIELADEPGIGLDMMDQRRESILRAFFVDVIRGISMRGDASPLKAAEVVARRNEALQALVPPITRAQREALSPIVERTFAIMARNDLLPEPPATIRGAPFDVEFVAPAAIAARLGEAEKIVRGLTQLSLIGQIDPVVFENLEKDKAARRLLLLNGVAPDLLTREGTAQRVRNQQAQQDQTNEAIGQGAEVAKAVGALQ